MYTEEMSAAWTATPELLIDVADHAARIVLRSRLLSHEDFEDARSCAVVDCWRASLHRPDHKRGYFFNVARYAIFNWLARQRAVENECSYDGFEWLHAQPAHEASTAPLDVERLRAFGEFTDKQMTYLRYVTEGYSMPAIGQVMGLGKSGVHRYRTKLLPRLYRLAGQQPVKRQRVLTDAHHRDIAQWRADGISWAEIAHRLDCSIQAVESGQRRYKARQLAAHATV